MFSLIITIISIALVAALALATLYYGGDIFNDGAERALVSRIEAQAQQLMGALDLYKADTGAYPATLDLLVSSNYLKSLPTALESTQNALSSAYAATSTWTLAGPYAPVTVLAPVSEATCKAFNKVKYGQAGVLKTLRMQLGQCFGTDVNNLMIVTAKSTADLVAVAADPAAAIQLGAVLPDVIPAADSTDTSNAGWLVAPGALGATVTSVAYLDGNGAALGSLIFADTAVATTSAPSTVTVKNTSSTSLTLTSTGATVGAPFSISASTCAAATLAPNATCTVALTFSPTAAQAYAGASYALSMQASGATLAALPLSGTGTAPTAPLVTAPFFKDTFQGPVGTPILAHTPDIGGGWLPVNNQYTYTAYTLDGAGGLSTVDGPNTWDLGTMVLATSPTTAEYYVEFDITSTNAGDWSSNMQLNVRDNDGNCTASCYQFYHYIGGSTYGAYEVDIYATNNSASINSNTLAFGVVTGDSPPYGYAYAPGLVAGQSYHYRYEIRNSMKRLLVDGVELLAFTDNTVTAPGKISIALGDRGGLFIKNFQAGSL